MDITRPPDRIRQDPSRSPGGDSRVFLNTCIGCHSGMDALAGAFAYYNYDTGPRQMVYTPGQVQAQVRHQHRQLPVRSRHASTTAGSTTGAAARMRCWAGAARCRAAATVPSRSARRSRTATQFANCQVQKVFQAMCLRPPSNAADRSAGGADHLRLRLVELQHEDGVRRDRRLLHGPVGGRRRESPDDTNDGTVCLLAAMTALLLGACSGGAPTTQNPNLQAAAQVATYTGPPPGSADVAGVRGQSVGEHLTEHRAAATVTRPAASRRCSRAPTTSIRPTAPRSRSSTCRSPTHRRWCTKVAGGHNCWLSSPSGLRRHPDHLDPELGRRRQRAPRPVDADPADGAAVDQTVGADQGVPGRLRRCSAPRSIRWCSSICSRCHSRYRDHAAVAVLCQQQPRPGLRCGAAQDQPEYAEPVRAFYVRLAHRVAQLLGQLRSGDCPASAARHAGGDPGIRQWHCRHAGRSDAGRLEGAVAHAGHDRLRRQSLRRARHRQVEVQGRHRLDRIRHQRRRSGHEPDAVRQYHLGRRLGPDLRHRRREAQASTATSSKLYGTI